MKTLAAEQTENSFAEFVDMAKHEPVVITEEGSPISVTLSVKDVRALVGEEDELPSNAEAGILSGLVDADSGRMTAVTIETRDQFISDLVSELGHRRGA